MDDDEKELLNKILDETRENNKMISKLYRGYRWTKFWRFIYWGVVIILILGGYIAIRPYLEQFTTVYRQLMSLVGR